MSQGMVGRSEYGSRGWNWVVKGEEGGERERSRME